MNLFSLRVLSPALLLFAAACGGGGDGGGGGPVPESDQIPATYLPSRPAGLGAAGLMDGTWRIVDVQLVDDARNSNADIEQAWLQVDDEVRFENGRMAEDEDEDPSEPDPNTPDVPIVIEYLTNRVEAGATLFGWGIRIGDNNGFGRGTMRLGTVFGTLDATRATGVVVQQMSFPEVPYLPADQFMVTTVMLERVQP